MSWDSLKISSILPKELTNAANGLSSVIDTYTAASEAANDALKAAEASISGVDLSPIQAVLNTIKQALDALINAGKIHVLFVPIAKPITITSSLNINSDVESDTLLSEENKRLYSSVLNGTSLGNKGFFKTFLDSLSDIGDVNRPRFSNTDHIGCHVLLAGEASLTKILVSAAILDRILDAKRSTLTNRIIPTPKNLQTRVIAVPGSSRVGVRLDWDKQETEFSPKYYPIVLAPTRTAVIRSTASVVQSAHCITDIFATSLLKKGTKSVDGKSEVIDIILPNFNSYLDSVNLTKGTTYYYVLAQEIEATELVSSTNMGFDKISNTCKVSYKNVTPTQISKAPDWQAYGSGVDLFPQLSTGLQLISEEVDILANRSDGLTSALSTQLDLLSESLDFYTKKAELISGQLETLTATLSATVGVYHTSFSGKGGNNLAVSNMYNALFTVSDTTRPPFDGSQYTAGVIILYGAGREIDITPIQALFDLLLGSNSGSSPTLTALTSIDAILTQQETIFNQALRPISDPSLADPITGITTGNINPTTGLPVVVTGPQVISSNGTAVSTTSSDNPLLDETGEVTIKC